MCGATHRGFESRPLRRSLTRSFMPRVTLLPQTPPGPEGSNGKGEGGCPWALYFLLRRGGSAIGACEGDCGPPAASPLGPLHSDPRLGIVPAADVVDQASAEARLCTTAASDRSSRPIAPHGARRTHQGAVKPPGGHVSHVNGLPGPRARNERP